MTKIPISISSIPQRPGCYFFKDDAGTILYIGKAKDLRKRVGSYFNRPPDSEKTAELVKRAVDIEFLVVDTEVEALLLEARLIRQHRPRFNIDLKDSERYAYIMVTNEPFPRVITARGKLRKGLRSQQASIKPFRWFGPFVDGTHRRSLIRTINLLTKMRICQTLPKRACIQYHIGNCTAPCIKKVSGEEYRAQASQAINLLEGKTESVIARLMEEMAEASRDLRFERAKELRDHLEILSRKADRQKVDFESSKDQDAIAIVKDSSQSLIQVFHVKRGVLLGKREFRFSKESSFSSETDMTEFLMQFYTSCDIPNEILVESLPEDSTVLEESLAKIKGRPIRFVVPSKGRSKELLDLVRKNALIQLGEGDVGLRDLQDCLKLPAFPKVIECFDISHLSGKQTVASMVQLIDGKPRKSNYRRFKIKTVEGIDDVSSMYEVVARRYRRLKDEGKPFPNLIVVDGGAGQLSAARRALGEVGVSIPVIGLAKRLEEIYLPFTDNPLRLDSKREALLVLQRARDEAHRFAVGYHRILRRKRDLQ